MQHLLDNPAWNALNTGNQNLSNGNKTAKYFSPDVSPFSGIAELTRTNFDALYEAVPFKGSFAFVSATKIDIPEPWKMVQQIGVLQMVFDEPVKDYTENSHIVSLSEENIPEMLALTKLTNPGPFAGRTIYFGHYRGIFVDGKLAAMAGQRMNPAPYAEISAVCTHPDHLGKGYAKQLLLNQAHRIQMNNEIPFLHVLSDNTRAIEVYKAVGFSVRKEINIYIIQN